MDKITTYYATRKNIFVWLAALLSICSAVARIVFAIGSGRDENAGILIPVIIPVIACLFLAFRFPLRCDKQFYITVIPVIVLSLCLCASGLAISGSGLMSALVVVLTAAFCLLYFLTFDGILKTKWIVLLLLAALIVYAAVSQSFRDLIAGHPERRWLEIGEAASVLAVLAALLSAHKMAPWKEGDPYRLRFGDRLDGRRIRNMPVMSKVTPYFMMNRLGRSNYISETVEVTHMEQYIREKRNQGLKHFGITHVFVAAYLRMMSELPEVNRFVAGQRIYHRFNVCMNMIVKKELSKDSPDSQIKVFFDLTDTAKDVYEKFDAALEVARQEGDANGFDSVTHILDYMPSLVMSLFGVLVRVLDYFGLLPLALIESASPFHGSLFITSMGSLGIPPVYHHLYDFGTVPVFGAFGHKYTKYEVNKNGEPVIRKYLDYRFTCDEGICDGYVYAAAMKKLKANLMHPEKLDLPPENVVEDIY